MKKLMRRVEMKGIEGSLKKEGTGHIPFEFS